jgi:hypothetical protein
LLKALKSTKPDGEAPVAKREVCLPKLPTFWLGAPKKLFDSAGKRGKGELLPSRV